MNDDKREQASRGLFVMLEGTDGSGKTTQTQLLVDRLKNEGKRVETISFPQYGSPSAAMVEAYLSGEFGSASEVGPYRASILYAVDRFAAKPHIEQWLAEGAIVIANRYVASNMGHQGGKIADPEERTAYFTWNYDLEYTIFGIPRPDVNIILHVPTEVSQRLIAERTAQGTHDRTGKDIHEEDLAHLQQAEAAYLAIAEQFPEFHLLSCVADGTLRTREDIHQDIWQLLFS